MGMVATEGRGRRGAAGRFLSTVLTCVAATALTASSLWPESRAALHRATNQQVTAHNTRPSGAAP